MLSPASRKSFTRLVNHKLSTLSVDSLWDGLSDFKFFKKSVVSKAMTWNNELKGSLNNSLGPPRNERCLYWCINYLQRPSNEIVLQIISLLIMNHIRTRTELWQSAKAQECSQKHRHVPPNWKLLILSTRKIPTFPLIFIRLFRSF